MGGVTKNTCCARAVTEPEDRGSGTMSRHQAGLGGDAIEGELASTRHTAPLSFLCFRGCRGKQALGEHAPRDSRVWPRAW